MVNLKNYMADIKTEEERGKNGEKKRFIIGNKPTNLFMHASFFMDNTRDVLKTILKR